MNKKILVLCLVVVVIAIIFSFILINNGEKTVPENITVNDTLNDTIKEDSSVQESSSRKPLTYCSECGAALYDSNMCESCNAKARQKYYDAVANGEDTSFSEPKPDDEIVY